MTIVVFIAATVAGCTVDGGPATSVGSVGDGDGAGVSTTFAAPVVTSTFAPNDERIAGSWLAVEDSGVFGGPGRQELKGIAWSGGTWVAIGLTQGEDAVDVGRADAAVWASSDGIDWTGVGRESPFSELGSQSMLAVTPWGPGFVAVGAAERTHQDDPAVWLSEDGYSWVRVDDSTGAFKTGTFAQMWDVTVGGPGLVAVGFVGAIDTFDAGVWVSSDGTIWERVIDGSFAGARNEFMTGIVALENGQLVAVGNEEVDGWRSPAVWVSDDGISWEKSQGFSTDHSGAMFDVATWDRGLVAVGRDGSGGDLDAAAWVSTDGTEWHRIDDQSLGGPGDQAIAGVASFGTEIIAVGYDRISDRNAAIWRSTDGFTWSRTSEEPQPTDGFQELLSVATSNDLVVAVGYSGVIGEWDGAVWLRSR